MLLVESVLDSVKGPVQGGGGRCVVGLFWGYNMWLR